MSSIPSLLDLQALPSREFRLRKLKEYTCTVCRATYETRNPLNRHIRSKHVPKLQCFFCDKNFPVDRNTRRALHMLQADSYPVPEQFLQEPFNPQCTCSQDGDWCVKPCDWQFVYLKLFHWCGHCPSLDLAGLFPVEETDTSGVQSVRLPSSPVPYRCSTPLLDDQPPFVSQTSDAEVGNVVQPPPLELLY